MHAPLDTPEKQMACAGFIAALERCHAQNPWRLFGGCNSEKTELGMCLRQERIERTTRNREAAKFRTAKKKEVWAELEKEQAQSQSQSQVRSEGPEAKSVA